MPSRTFHTNSAEETVELGRTLGPELKGAVLLIGNLGPLTFGLDDNEVVLFEASGITRLPRADKKLLAKLLIAEIAKRAPRGGSLLS